MSREDSPPRARFSEVPRDEVVKELKGYFDDKFSALQRDLKRDAEWTVSSATKKVKRVSLISFKSYQNRKQFEFNNSILDLLENIEKAVSYREASKAVANNAISHRNKLIRIADGSDLGWSTINEYELLEVASDSDDDKRIRRAEERAKKKADKNAYLYDNGLSSSFRSNRLSRVMEGQRFSQVDLEGRRFGQGDLEGRRFVQGEVICYKCGQEGHYANFCSSQ